MTSSETAGTKSRLIFILLAVFFGFMGTHNFYAERYKIAVVQFCVTALIFWLIVPAFAIWIWALWKIYSVKSDGSAIDFMPLPRPQLPTFFKKESL
jgi:TM2 domain-containing membrane protein YozV